MKDISVEIKAYFRSKGITQQQIADMLGVSQPYVGCLLRGDKAFGKNQAKKFHDLFGFSVSWLLTGEGSMFDNSTNQVINITKGGSTSVTGDGNALFGSQIENRSTESQNTDLVNKLLDELAAQRKQNDELISIIKSQLNNGR